MPIVGLSTAAGHLAELAQGHGETSTSSHAVICVQLPDSFVDSKFLPVKLDALLVARSALIDRCCSRMWAAVSVQAAGKQQLPLG